MTLPGGGIEAIGLASGKSLWTSRAISYPLGIDGEQFVGLSSEETANTLRLVVLDRSSGKVLRKSARVALQNWVSAQASNRCGFQSRWTRQGSDFFVQWQSRSDWDPVKSIVDLSAEGTARISARTGQVSVIHHADFPISDATRDSARLLALQRAAVSTLRFTGDVCTCLVHRVADGKSSILLGTWDRKSGNSLGARTVLKGKFTHVASTLDLCHVGVLGSDGVETFLHCDDGATVLKVKKPPPTGLSRLIAGKRGYFLTVSHGQLRQRDRRLVRPQHLQVMDLETHKLLWARDTGPFFIGLYNETATPLELPADVAIPALVKSLQAAEAHVRNNAAEDLGQVGAAARPALPAMLAVLKDRDTNCRLRAAESVLQLDSKNEVALATLIGALKADSKEQRAAAADSLGMLGAASNSAAPALAAMLRADKDTWGRTAAARALGRITGNVDAIAALVAALKDPEEGVRFFAARSLTNHGRNTRPFLPELRAALRSGEYACMTAALSCLRWHGDAGILELRNGMRDVIDYPESIAEFLAQVPAATNASVLTLAPLLWSNNRDVSLQAALAVARLVPKDKREPIALRVWALLADAHEGKFSELTVVEVLFEVRDHSREYAKASAVPFLRQMLGSTPGHVRNLVI